MPDLSGLREGDEIAISSSLYETVIRRVVKVHKHYLVDNAGQKWLLDNGHNTPRSHAWDFSRAEPANDVHRALIESAKTRAECRRVLDDLAPRAARDANIAMRILEALRPIMEEETRDA